MPAPYGVVPAGFSVKALTEILASLEAALVQEFGADVVLDPESPLGQINGVMSDALAEVYEVSGAVYHSFNPATATGARLDNIGKLRPGRVERLPGESDADFSARLTNDSVSNIKTRELYNKLATIAGVTWVNITENSTHEQDSNGLPPHSIAIALEGGDEADIVDVIYNYSVGGIGLHGNTESTGVIDGLCRTVRYSRPVQVPIEINLDLSVNNDRCQCSPSSSSIIAQSIAQTLSNYYSLYNGMTLTRRVIARAMVVHTGFHVECVKFGRLGGNINIFDDVFSIDERPTISADNISITFVAVGAGCKSVGEGVQQQNVLLKNTADDEPDIDLTQQQNTLS